jgi:hypothetical protein
VGDGSVRMRMAVIVVVIGAIAAGEHKDTAATLSKYLLREREKDHNLYYFFINHR